MTSLEAAALVRRYLDQHCAASDADGCGALCECRICLDARAALATGTDDRVTWLDVDASAGGAYLSLHRDPEVRVATSVDLGDVVLDFDATGILLGVEMLDLAKAEEILDAVTPQRRDAS